MEHKELLKQAEKSYLENFDNTAWYGRCIFLSWYCDIGTCKFCFRSTQKHKIKYAQNAKRTIASVLVEALLCRKLGWRIEFLTGGYRIFPTNELVKITELVSKVYGEKIWLNLGVISKEDLAQFKLYVKGVVSSIETIEPELHNKLCPDKPIEPYEKMFDYAEGLKKSMTIVIGLGEKKEDFSLLAEFIRKRGLDRITFYALKPVKGTLFENSKGPSTEDYLWWIAKTRNEFPKLEIIAGTTAKRYEEVGLLMKAGANAFTKFPATKMFGTLQAFRITKDITDAGRELAGTVTKLPEIDWDEEINQLKIEDNIKEKMKKIIKLYLKRMGEKWQKILN